MLIVLKNKYWLKGQQIRAHGSCLRNAGLGIIAFLSVSHTINRMAVVDFTFLFTASADLSASKGKMALMGMTMASGMLDRNKRFSFGFYSQRRQ